MQYIVGYVHYVIDRTQTDYIQTVFQPFRTFFHRYALDGNAGVTGTCFRIFNDHFDSRSFIVDLESVDRRTFQFCRLTVLFQVSSQVAGNTEMGSSVHTVRSDIHFQHVVALYIIIFLGRSSYNRISRKHDNTGMVCSDTDLIFRTDHTVRLNATDF